MTPSLHRPGRVLIIAGSDSGGGAGIQADIKTVTALRGFATTAVTAITVQNTLGVTGVHPVPLNMIEAQARAVLDDLGADAIKTGMLGDAATVRLVAALLAQTDAPAVVDPVMVAKGGHALLADSAIDAVRRDILPQAALLTPNAPEAAVLTGLLIETTDDLRRAGVRLLELGARAVLMKGGHIAGEQLVDILMTPHGETRFEGARIPTRSTHGTGCTLSSAIATGLANGLELVTAITAARAYLMGAILNAPGYGAGHGPLDHGWAMGAADRPLK